jgi:hypothetical protein
MCPAHKHVSKAPTATACAVKITPIPDRDVCLPERDTKEECNDSRTIKRYRKPQDCPYCDQHFPSKASLHLHVRSCHESIRTFRCGVCNLYFKSKEEKSKHSKEHHRQKCILCTKSFHRLSYLLNHLRNKHANEFFVCEYNVYCGKVFKTEEERKSHILNVHESGPKLAECIYCKKIYSKLWGHMRRHHSLEAIKCKYCAIYFQSEEDREKHYAEVHERDEKSQCSICGKFLSADAIYTHMRRIHDIDPVSGSKSNSSYSKCPYCDAKVKILGKHISRYHKSIAIRCKKVNCKTYFLSEEERRQHVLNIHSTATKVMKKKVECLYCGKEIVNYVQHVKENHAKIAIRCKYKKCVSYFNSSNERVKHYLEKHPVTEQLKWFSCNKCNYKSISSRNLKIHREMIHGNANLKCALCFKSYKSEHSFKVHIKKVHS